MTAASLAILGAVLLCLLFLAPMIRSGVNALAERGRAELIYLRGLWQMREEARRKSGAERMSYFRSLTGEEIDRQRSQIRRIWTPAMVDIATHNSDRPCPACLARCTECADDGKRTCQAFGCGGRGIRIHAQKFCDALPMDRKHPKKCICGGSRRIVTQSDVCPVCQGTKREICSSCRGTTQIGTGLMNHAPAAGHAGRAEAWAAGIAALFMWQSKAPKCVACRGTGWEQETLDSDEKKNLENVRKTVARLRETGI
jgi:hypothetical protein